MNKCILLFAVFCISFSVAEFEVYRPIYIREGPPVNSGWNVVGRADPSYRVKFTISMQQQNLHELESRFWSNSDPKSPLYAKHMTRDEISTLTAPSLFTQKSVLRWIYSISVPKGNVFSIENEGDAVVITSTALFAEKLFKTRMYMFSNERNNAVACKHLGSLSIPMELTEMITLITGITELLPTKFEFKSYGQQRSAKKQVGDNSCNVAYSIKNLYQVPTDLYITEKDSNASIYSSTSSGGEDSFNLQAAEDYQEANGLPNNPITCIIGSGSNQFMSNDTEANEANLDIQMLTGMAPNVDICFYLMDGDGWIYDFTRYIFKTPEAPLVVSISYEGNENGNCDPQPGSGNANCTYYNIPNNLQYINLTNINLQKLGLLGLTILTGSGDDGIAGVQQTDDNCTTQQAAFPAASPYITTVGATSVEDDTPSPHHNSNPLATLPPICTDMDYECACSTSKVEAPASQNNSAQFDTGGGFSYYTPMPQYQKSAVQAYLNSGVTLPSQYFNGSNRGYPDIAAVGANICLVLGTGEDAACQLIGGTSASTPIIAGLVALLNNDRIAAGKTPLGFINPIIYDMFDTDADTYFQNDFGYGNNAGECSEDMGFNYIAHHWTPLTGVGTPNFANIRKYVASLN